MGLPQAQQLGSIIRTITVGMCELGLRDWDGLEQRVEAMGRSRGHSGGSLDLCSARQGQTTWGKEWGGLSAQ